MSVFKFGQEEPKLKMRISLSFSFIFLLVCAFSWYPVSLYMSLELRAFPFIANQCSRGRDTGALLILLAIGIKAAFHGLHVWLKDGYAEATHSVPSGYVPSPRNVRFVCLLVCLCRNLITNWNHYGNLSNLLRSD